MKKVTISALAFAVLLAAATPAGSQTRPRRVGPSPDVYSESGPRSRAEEERAAGERPRRGSRWRRVLFEAGLAAAAVRGVGRSCTPSRRVIAGAPR
ncbi:MAG: hypothetical protein JOZ02_05005 [Acidobacteria bacterium]|nr:hypothetical protein [Acidobacteriota bacterium]